MAVGPQTPEAKFEKYYHEEYCQLIVSIKIGADFLTSEQ